MDLKEFINHLDSFATWDGKKQVDYLAFFLLTHKGLSSFTAKQIDECFDDIPMNEYSRTAPYLSEEVAKRSGKYKKIKSRGYTLVKHSYDEIHLHVQNEPSKTKVSHQLTDLIAKVSDLHELSFLQEAINCIAIKAPRAAVVMLWILTMSHLENYIFLDINRLKNFNDAVTKHPNKKSVKEIKIKDDFSEIKESIFIELMSSANIISGDVRKILDEKLGIRNTSGHPAGVIISEHKATEFAIEVINNVLLKY
jgi:hypothetical protein